MLRMIKAKQKRKTWFFFSFYALQFYISHALFGLSYTNRAHHFAFIDTRLEQSTVFSCLPWSWTSRQQMLSSKTRNNLCPAQDFIWNTKEILQTNSGQLISTEHGRRAAEKKWFVFLPHRDHTHSSANVNWQCDLGNREKNSSSLLLWFIITFFFVILQ